MRFVDYKLTADDASKVIEGNPASEGDVFPMLVTKEWPTSVNGRVFTDGPVILWVTSVTQGDRPGQWQPGE